MADKPKSTGTTGPTLCARCGHGKTSHENGTGECSAVSGNCPCTSFMVAGATG